ncbi:MAG: acetyl-CoA carboxylase biotin carboxyl carrier protein subunit [Elusimicrobia bacterium]|nr:acetyl-CoA carboxylase biotin carboxyl carrier protein subunit [Elusimicrobiota bacterium]
MNTKLITEISSWMKKTDLAEVTYRKDGNCVELKTEDAQPDCSMPSCQYSAAASPAVGIYRSAPAGKSSKLGEGSAVKAGQRLGYIEMLGEKKPVTSPCEGTIKISCIEDGEPVQYGQPLFFIEPK